MAIACACPELLREPRQSSCLKSRIQRTPRRSRSGAGKPQQRGLVLVEEVRCSPGSPARTARRPSARPPPGASLTAASSAPPPWPRVLEHGDVQLARLHRGKRVLRCVHTADDDRPMSMPAAFIAWIAPIAISSLLAITPSKAAPVDSQLVIRSALHRGSSWRSARR